MSKGDGKDPDIKINLELRPDEIKFLGSERCPDCEHLSSLHKIGRAHV